MDVNQKLTSLQNLVNKTKLYQKLIDSNFFFNEKNRNIMNTFKDIAPELFEEVLTELVDFAKIRMDEITNNTDHTRETMPYEAFTEEEVKILKSLVLTIKTKRPQNKAEEIGSKAELASASGKGLESVNNSHSHNGQKTPVQVASAQNNSKPFLRNASKVAENRQKNSYITEDVTPDMDPKQFIGRLTRTMGHSSLRMNTKPVNDPETYATVKLNDIRKDSGTWVADIEFIDSGVKGQINLSELSPWEYLE